MNLNWSRADVEKDEEYDEMVDFYYFCFVTKLDPRYVDEMGMKERKAAADAFMKMQKGINKKG